MKKETYKKYNDKTYRITVRFNPRNDIDKEIIAYIKDKKELDPKFNISNMVSNSILEYINSNKKKPTD